MTVVGPGTGGNVPVLMTMHLVDTRRPLDINVTVSRKAPFTCVTKGLEALIHRLRDRAICYVPSPTGASLRYEDTPRVYVVSVTTMSHTRPADQSAGGSFGRAAIALVDSFR